MKKKFEAWFLSINDVDENLLNKKEDGSYVDSDINLMFGSFCAGYGAGESDERAAVWAEEKEDQHNKGIDW